MSEITHIPYPYEQYTYYNLSPLKKDFEEFKEMVYGWVKSSTINKEIDFDEDLRFISSDKPTTWEKGKLKNWLKNHRDRIKYIYDFSGIEFGIEIDERWEDICIKFPQAIKESDEYLYPDYSFQKFKEMNMIERLIWMDQHCEFIPYRVIRIDDTDISNSMGEISFKFYYLKREVGYRLSDFLSKLDYQPRDDVYYFYRYNKKTKHHYLVRDFKKSPRKERPVRD